MSRVPDRKKQRREYLKQIGMVFSLETLYFFFLMPVTLTAIMSGIVFVLTLLFAVVTGTLASNKQILLPLGVIAVGSGLGAWGLWRIEGLIKKTRSQIAYVPPVTSDTLPAEEVLVRGSEQPVQAQKEVLVRPAKGEETPQEQLLRSSPQPPR